MNLNRLRTDRDYLFSVIIGAVTAVIAGIMIWKGLTWLWNWFSVAGGESSEWLAIWEFCKANLSILIVIYGLMSLHAAGLAELQYGKNFLKAFGLALILTPPLIMVVYGHKKE